VSTVEDIGAARCVFLLTVTEELAGFGCKTVIAVLGPETPRFGLLAHLNGHENGSKQPFSPDFRTDRDAAKLDAWLQGNVLLVVSIETVKDIHRRQQRR
jgi:hypothetical protein